MLKTFFFMGQNRMNSKCKKNIAVIGGGPAGCMAAITACENNENEIVIFDKNDVLKTLLPTGGGRCNLAFSEFDFKELTKFYPRGEKFLYSVFSKFSTADTIDFFKKIGIKTYTQVDKRIFPVSDSSLDVIKAMQKQLKKLNISLEQDEVTGVEKTENGFYVLTKHNKYKFDIVIIATGGRGSGHKLAKNLGHTICDLRPALSSLKILETHLSGLAGVSMKDVSADIYFQNKKQKTVRGDLLFTHNGISGPFAYKISSYFTYCDFNKENPLTIKLNFVGKTFESFDKEFMEILNCNAQKEIHTIVSQYIPKSLTDNMLQINNVDDKIKCGQLSKKDRQIISKNLTEFTIKAVDITRGEEIVTAGGVKLSEIDAKTMCSKLVDDLYFCGEIIDVDGLTGGFNLQNCWSTGFVVGKSLL